MRRIQIRETILSHFEKEEKLFNMGIKSLSLFFIDEVAKYRQYDTDGNEVLGEYGQMFEQEYLNVLNEYTTVFDTPYQKYLKSTCSDVSAVHKGYFSIDKKTEAHDNLRCSYRNPPFMILCLPRDESRPYNPYFRWGPSSPPSAPLPERPV